ncbi:MAG: T9SS type A sorting domain-containing protein [Bacteroidota bacterium]
MRKISVTIVLALFAAVTYGQKFSGWEAGTPPPHAPASAVLENVGIEMAPSAGVEAVRQVLLAQKAAFMGGTSDLIATHDIPSPGGFHYTYQQTLAGIPVYQASIKANLYADKRIHTLLSTLRPVSAPVAEFQHDIPALRHHLEALYDQGQANFAIEAERVWFPRDNTLYPAFRVELARATRLWELIIADADFAELQRRDLASYCRPLPPPVDTSGVGMVFLPDPLTSSGNVYGGNYVDNSDADSDALNNERVEVTLQDINWNGTFFLLEGPYVRIADVESPSSAPATSLNGNFIYTREEQGFEDVMCYYHIDSYQRYIQSLGFNNLMNAQLTVDPHGLNGQDNSHFVPQGGNIRLAFGEGGVDDAEDADVVVHEYGHALSYSAAPGTNGGLERTGLDEGIGDYISASYSRSLYYALWKNTFTWDGHNEFWPGRTASTSMLYPPSTADIYLYGQIWATALMEIYGDIGRTATDNIFFESLYGHQLNMDLPQAGVVFLKADSALYNGIHTNVIQRAFCNRNIWSGTGPGGACFVSRTDPSLDESAWELFPNPTTTEVTIRIADVGLRKNVRYEVVDLMGQVLRQGDIRQQYTQAPLTGLASGLYLVQIMQGDLRLGSKRLEILR